MSRRNSFSALSDVTNHPGGRPDSRPDSRADGRQDPVCSRPSSRSSSAAGAEESTTQQPTAEQQFGFAPPVAAHPALAPLQPSRTGTPADDGERSATFVAEYSEEIIQHLMRRERQMIRDGAYMEQQTEVTERMRQILVDWIIDVAQKFKLHSETLYLAVDIIDRYLSRAIVTRAQLQLVGITAILIAAKHDEIWPPEVAECAHISANTYTNDEILAMERRIATALVFRFTVPTPYPIFCRLLDMMTEVSPSTAEMTRYASSMFLDCAAHDYALVSCLPSRVACAAVLLGRMMARAASHGLAHPSAHWDAEMHYHSQGVLYAEIEPIARRLLATAQALVSPNSRLQAVRRKYMSQQRFGGVANVPLPTFPADEVAA